MPPTNFTDLAARMSADLAGVRACLILSRDGLSLGAHPSDGEPRAREAWDTLQRIGDPQRGFIDMGTEIWVMACGSAYAAVMVATPDAKPGLLLDRMGAHLLAAEESRSLPPPELVRAAAKVVDLSAAGGSQGGPDLPPVSPPPAPPARAEKVEKEEEKPPARPIRPGNIDRVALAREFGRLLDDNKDGS